MDRYDPKQIEPKWQAIWADERTWEVSNEPDERPNAYVLEMLPYPSGEPHIGHLKNYALGDAVAHFRGATATACCTRSATTPSDCRPRTTRSTPASIRAIPPSLDTSLSERATGVGRVNRLDARVRHERAEDLPLDAVDLPAPVRAWPGLPQGGRGASGAPTTRPFWPTSRSSTAAASVAATWSKSASSSSGSSASPSTRIACSTTWPPSSGPRTSSSSSATGSGARRALR